MSWQRSQHLGVICILHFAFITFHQLDMIESPGTERRGKNSGSVSQLIVHEMKLSRGSTKLRCRHATQIPMLEEIHLLRSGKKRSAEGLGTHTASSLQSLTSSAVRPASRISRLTRETLPTD